MGNLLVRIGRLSGVLVGCFCLQLAQAERR